jgi:hypothetical protein
MAAPSSVDIPSPSQPDTERVRPRRKRHKRLIAWIGGAIVSVVAFLSTLTGAVNDGLGIWGFLTPSPVTTTPSAPATQQPTPQTSAPRTDVPATAVAGPPSISGPRTAAQPTRQSRPSGAGAKRETPNAPGRTSTAPAPAYEAVALPLVDQQLVASTSVHVATCATGGRTFSQSFILAVPSSDPAKGSFARADFIVPPGSHRLVATMGLVDGSPSSSTVGVHVFIESPPNTFTSYTLPAAGSAISVDVAVTPGMRLRIQASASAARQVCLGAPRLEG